MILQLNRLTAIIFILTAILYLSSCDDSNCDSKGYSEVQCNNYPYYSWMDGKTKASYYTYRDSSGDNVLIDRERRRLRMRAFDHEAS